MIMTQTLALFFAVLSAAAVLRALRRARRPLRTALGSAALGAGALAAVNLMAGYTGVTIALNYATSFVAVVLGAPGVVLMLALRLILLF